MQDSYYLFDSTKPHPHAIHIYMTNKRTKRSAGNFKFHSLNYLLLPASSLQSSVLTVDSPPFTMTTKKAQLVFVPSPVIGHLVSTIEFAKLLINRDDRLYITFLVMKLPFDTTTDAYTESLASSSFSKRVHVINLPQCHIPSTSQSHVGSNMNFLIENQKPNIKEAVSNLIDSNSNLGPDSPRLAAFVVDMFCTTVIDVAKQFGVPALVFYTSGVAFLGLVLHLHTLRERDNVNTTELKDTDTELAIPSFANPVPAKALPSVVLHKEWDSFFLTYAKRLKEADGIIVNSFEELESHAVHSFSEGDIPIYPVGPILNLKVKDKGDSDTVTDSDNSTGSESEIIKWLDDQPPSSVIFLCFGSRGRFDEDQVREIARALEDSGARFLLSLRKPALKGSVAKPSDYPLPDLAAVLPEGFLDRTAGIGRVIGWAPQVQVLAHQATGGFVSHCGWNSTLESIYFGVPIATWPLFAEQQTNAFELVCELKMAVEIALDYRMEFMVGRNNRVLSAEKIERGIRDVLGKDGEIRKKVKEMSENSRKTLTEGGCSYSYLGRLIDYIMNQV